MFMSSKLPVISQHQRYMLKRKLEEVEKCKGRATELISLYVPPGRQISDVVAYLRNEYSQSSNIKSRVTRKNVMWAIESLINKVKVYKEPPPNGIVFFVGNKAVSSDQTEPVSYVIEPIEPINTYMYRCDSFFYVEPLEVMTDIKDVYGLIVMDRKEVTLGFLKGTRIIPIKNKQSMVPSKHGRGGQSQHRFERLIEQAAHAFFVNVATLAEDAFLPVKDSLKGILLGGPGPTKDFFLSENYLHYELQKKVLLPLIDVGYTDEYGLREVVEKSVNILADLDITKEKHMIEHFLLEIKKGSGLAIYGEKEVMESISKGIVDSVFISENIRKGIVTYRCNICNSIEKVSITDTTKKMEPSIKCSRCDGTMTITENQDFIDSIYTLADKYGTKVEMISADFDEGEMFYKAFNGLGALLRYATISH